MKGWFPGIKDAAYWREINARAYEHKARQARSRRISKRPEPTEIFSANAQDGAELRIGRAGSKAFWYLETIKDGDVVEVHECRKMSKKDAQEYLDGAVWGYNDRLTKKERPGFDVEALTIAEAIDALEEIRATLPPDAEPCTADNADEAQLSAELFHLGARLQRAREIIAMYPKN